MSPMTSIPDELLAATGGTVVALHADDTPHAGFGSVVFELNPFTVDEALAEVSGMDAGELVDTSVEVELIAFDGVSKATDLAGRTFEFDPTADEPEGSVYVQHAHHPVDVERIVFGEMQAGHVSATLHARADWSFEGLGELEGQDIVLAAELAAFDTTIAR